MSLSRSPPFHHLEDINATHDIPATAYPACTTQHRHPTAPLRLPVKEGTRAATIVHSQPPARRGSIVSVTVIRHSRTRSSARTEGEDFGRCYRFFGERPRERRKSSQLSSIYAAVWGSTEVPVLPSRCTSSSFCWWWHPEATRRTPNVSPWSLIVYLFFFFIIIAWLIGDRESFARTNYNLWKWS